MKIDQIKSEKSLLTEAVFKKIKNLFRKSKKIDSTDISMEFRDISDPVLAQNVSDLVKIIAKEHSGKISKNDISISDNNVLFKKIYFTDVNDIEDFHNEMTKIFGKAA